MNNNSSSSNFDNLVSADNLSTTLDYLKTNPTKLLQIQAIRAWITSKRAEKLSGGLQFSNSSFARKGTVNHNSTSLQSLQGYDRGSQLIYPLLADSFLASHMPWLDFLVIGPRNEAEILHLAAHGAKRERVKAIDLISYSPYVEIGDMHEVNCDDNCIDIALIGWVLAYSSNPVLALKEICRVVRPGGYLCIGWDIAINPKDTYQQHDHFNAPIAESFLDPNDSLTIKSTRDIETCLRLAGQSFQTIYANDARFPFDSHSRQNILVIRNCKQKDDIYYHCLFRESIAIKQTLDQAGTSALPGIDIERITYRLKEHIKWIYKREYNEEAYHMMRQDFYGGINVDQALSENVSRQIPHLWSGASDYSTSFPITRTIIDGTSVAQVANIVEEIKSASFSLLSNPIGKSKIARLNFVVDHLLAEQAGLLATSAPQESSKRQFLDEARLWSFPEFAEIAFDSLLLKVAGDYLGTVPIISSLNVFVTDSGIVDQVQQSSDAQLFHRDKDLPSFIKVFIYLNDVDESNGPHQLVRSSHHGDGLAHCLADRRFSDIEIEASFAQSIYEILGSAGTTFFVDTRCLHRGKPVMSGTRRVVQVEYCNSLFGAEKLPLPLSLPLTSLPHLAELYEDVPRLFERFSIH